MSIPTVNGLALAMMREFGEDTSNSTLIAQFEQWIQDGYDEIGVQAEWKYLWDISSFSSVIGSRTYNLALTDSFSEEIAIKDSVTNIPLLKRKRQTIMEQGNNLVLSGLPEIWYVESFNASTNQFVIGLYPVPSEIRLYDVLGILQPQEFNSGSQLTFPREFIFLLKDGIRIKVKEDDKDYPGADRIKNRYLQNLQRMKAKNDTQIGLRQQMEIMDISSQDNLLVRLPPDHFRN